MCRDQPTKPFRSISVSRRSRAFSMVELLVALSIGAGLITTGVLIFQNFTASAKSSGTYLRVTLGSATLQNFYGLSQTALDVWVAPNYGRRIEADQLRTQFLADVSSASAVFCLGRGSGSLNNQRPVTIPVQTGFDGRALDLPDAFRQQLEVSFPSAAGIFTAYRGASLTPNASIFILQPSDGADELSVLAIYEIDVITTSTPAGTYASVRRYVGDTLTGFYDVFYQSASSLPFTPLVVCFERAARLSVVEGSAVDRLKQAAERPFYFVWWPDPGMPKLMSQSAASFGSADPRAAYANMNGQSGLFLVVPMFPAL